MFGEATSKLTVKIFAETAQFDKSMSQTTQAVKNQSQQLQKIGLSLAAIGAGITATFGLTLRSWANAGDEVAKLSQKTGFAAETLSELRYMADISGTSLSNLGVGIRNMSRVLYEAKYGALEYVQALSRLNLNTNQLLALKQEERFWAIANAIADISDPALKAAAAQEIFGRSGTDLIPLLNEGAEGMARLRQEAQELGIVFDSQAAKQAERFNDTMTRLGKSFDGLKFAIAEGLAPTVEGLAGTATGAIATFTQWTKENGELGKMINTLTMGFGAFSVVAGAALLTIPKLITGFTSLAAALKLTTSGLGLVGVGLAGAGLIGYGVMELKGREQLYQQVEGARQEFMQYAQKRVMTSQEADKAIDAGEKFLALLEQYDAQQVANYQGEKQFIDYLKGEKAKALDSVAQAEADLADAKARADQEAIARQEELIRQITVYNLNLEGQLSLLEQVGEKWKSVGSAGKWSDLSKALSLYTERELATWQQLFGQDWQGAMTRYGIPGAERQDPYAVQAYEQAKVGRGGYVSGIDIKLELDGRQIAEAMVGPLGDLVAQRSETGG